MRSAIVPSFSSTTTPVGAYRGAGQPEANHARERLLDAIARRVGVDPIEFRRHNLATADEFPLSTLGGVTYDCADPHTALDVALERLGLDRWRTEQAGRRSRADHIEIGIGIANYAQSSGRGTPLDAAQVEVRSAGTVVISCASPTHGQGHLTT
ncbi:MAG: molybdopterin-dependent oxidoreductase [Actinomycetia bacterium]|nr:molybdopterin-dependent oxidoreductase [Actinomycetes bacterium]